jgi:hypothetical protein
MSAEIISAANGLLTLKVGGRLTQPELAAAQKQAAEILQKEGRMSVLVLTEGFQGWERGGAWGDLSFQMENDPLIEKLAIVGEKQWEDLALLFASKGFRKFPVEYFAPTELSKARAWLAARP